MKFLLPLSILATTVSGADNCYVCGSADVAMGTPGAFVARDDFFNYSCSELQEELTNSSLSCIGATAFYENLLNAELDAACGCPGATTGNGGGSGASDAGEGSSDSPKAFVSAAVIVGAIASLMIL